MEDLNEKEADDLGLKMAESATDYDLGYSSFQSCSQHSSDSPASFSVSNTNSGKICNSGILFRQDQLKSHKRVPSLEHKKDKCVAPHRFTAPNFGTPLSRLGNGLTRSSSALGIRPRAWTCTSTPHSLSPPFCRARCISMELSSNCESIPGFDSVYGSDLSELLHSTTPPSLALDVPEQNSTKSEHLEDDKKLLMSLVSKVEEAFAGEKSSVQPDQELCFLEKMPSCKMSTPKVISQETVFYSPQLAKKFGSDKRKDIALSSTPGALHFNENFPVSKSTLDVSCSGNCKLDKLPKWQSAKERCLSVSSPDLALPSYLAPSSLNISDETVDLSMNCSHPFRGESGNQRNSTEDFISKLKPTFDEAYIPRAVMLDWNKTSDIKRYFTEEIFRSMKDVEKGKRKLALDLSESSIASDEQAVKAEHTKYKLLPDKNEGSQGDQGSSFEQKPLLDSSVSSLAENCTILDAQFKSPDSTSPSRYKDLSSITVPCATPNSVGTASQTNPHLNDNYKPKSTFFSSKALNSRKATPTFELVHWLTQVDAEHIKFNKILQLFLERTPYLLPNVLGHLSPEDLLSFSQVNRQCRGIVAESKPLALKVKNLKRSRLAAVSAVGKENLVHVHKNYHSDPGITRRALAEVNLPERSYCAIFEPPTRQQLKQMHNNSDASVHFRSHHQIPQHSLKDSFDHHPHQSHNLQIPLIRNFSPKSKNEEVIIFPPNTDPAKRMVASDPHLYGRHDRSCQRNAAPPHGSELKRDRLCVPSEFENEKNSKLTAFRKCSVQSCHGRGESNKKNVQASPRKILCAIQSAVSSFQAAVSPRKPFRERPAHKEKKSSRHLNFELEASVQEQESPECKSSNNTSRQLQKCNMLNHANKVMSQRSDASEVSDGPLPAQNCSESSDFVQRRPKSIALDPSPIKCPPRKLTLFSKATKKQLRRL